VPCQRFNIGKQVFHPLSTISASLPWDHIAIDLKEMPKSKPGYCYYLLVVDIFTKFVFLRPLQDKESKTIAGSLWSIFCDIGLPKILQSDNGKEFLNSIISQLTYVSHVDHRLITAYHPRANGAAERSIFTSSQILLKNLSGNTETWECYLPGVQLAMNARISSVHGSSPYSLMFARPLNGFADYSKAKSVPLSLDELKYRLEYMTSLVYPTIKESQDERNKIKQQRFLESHKITEFSPGAAVMVFDDIRASKTEPRYTGPFLVIRRTTGGSYLLKGPDGTEYRRAPSQLKLVTQNSVSPDTTSTAVDKILDHRLLTLDDSDRREHEYLVKWYKLSDDHNQWVHERSFDDLTPIRRYWKSLDKETVLPVISKRKRGRPRKN
jgi:hypothetical protein